jgi:hypothetical protein
MGSNQRCSEPSSSTLRSPPIDLSCTSQKIGTHPTISVPVILKNRSVASAYGMQHPPIYTHTSGWRSHSIHTFSSLPLPFHFATQTQHHGVVEEGCFQRRLGPSSGGVHLHDHRQGGQNFGSTAGRILQFAPLQQGYEEGVVEPWRRQSLQPRAPLPVYDLGRC